MRTARAQAAVPYGSPERPQVNKKIWRSIACQSICCRSCAYWPFALRRLFAGVTVSSPANGSTYAGSVPYAASATSSCDKGVASMGIYTAPGVLTYVVNGSKLNTNLALGSGTYNTVVEAWDYCGGASTTPVKVTVGSGGGSGKTFSNIQRAGGWGRYGQGPPNFVDCSPSPCDGISFSMAQGVKSPSMSGDGC